MSRPSATNSFEDWMRARASADEVHQAALGLVKAIEAARGKGVAVNLTILDGTGATHQHVITHITCSTFLRHRYSEEA